MADLCAELLTNSLQISYGHFQMPSASPHVLGWACATRQSMSEYRASGNSPLTAWSACGRPPDASQVSGHCRLSDGPAAHRLTV